MKWDFEYYEEMTRHAVQKTQLLARTEEVDLVIWPESLVMEPITEARIGGMLESLTRNEAMWLYAGAVRHGSQLGESYNSSHLFRPDGSVVGHYDKIHLAPFGEYIPLAQYLPFVSNFVPAISDITPGEELVTFEAEHKRFGPLICFEVLFPRYAMAHRQAGADFLVVITNLAWFGASNAMAQELEMARIRAIESRLPVLHCANTGISGLIDPWGRFAAVDRYAYGARLSEPMTPPPPLEEVQRKRMAGAFDVPEPGGRCWPWGVRYLGWTAFGISVIGVVAAAFSGRPRPAAA
jgi:apolipoprotein N-acyltransferase